MCTTSNNYIRITEQTKRFGTTSIEIDTSDVCLHFEVTVELSSSKRQLNAITAGEFNLRPAAGSVRGWFRSLRFSVGCQRYISRFIGSLAGEIRVNDEPWMLVVRYRFAWFCSWSRIDWGWPRSQWWSSIESRAIFLKNHGSRFSDQLGSWSEVQFEIKFKSLRS